MDGELLEKAESIFGGVFLIWRRPALSWNSSTEKFCKPNGEDANARRGGADCEQHRQAAGAIAQYKKAPTQTTGPSDYQQKINFRFQLLVP
jgi:hypothetical protein